MIQLNPQENFPIVRQLSDPLDTGTYYVQAKIYDAQSNALLNTINMSNRGNQTFWGSWQVPADTSGMGKYVYSSITIYTDAAYTVVSSSYAVTTDTYLIQNRLTQALLGGGVGGYGGTGFAKIDYEKLYQGIEKQLEELVRKVVSEIKLPELPPFPDFPEIPQPIEQKEFDYSRIEKKLFQNKTELESTIGKIKDILGEHSNEIKKIIDSNKNFQNLKEVTKYFSNLSKYLESNAEDIKKHIDTTVSSNKTYLRGVSDLIEHKNEEQMNHVTREVAFSKKETKDLFKKLSEYIYKNN